MHRLLPSAVRLVTAPFLLAAASPALASGAAAADASPADSQAAIPAAIRAMSEAALATGNDTEISTIVKYARQADPASGDAVLALVTRWRADRDAKRHQTIEEARFLELWTGKAELGAFLTTGNAHTSGVNAALHLTREGLAWRQKFTAIVDYERSLGVTTRAHYLAAFEPNYKLDDRTYVYGQAQYESDRTLGYDDRLAASVGAGYSALKTPAITLNVELGPAYRRTGFTDGTEQNSLAARGSVDLKWKLLAGLSVTETTSGYLERYNSTLSSATAVNAKLVGPLSAQLSYNVQYESQPPAGSATTDTPRRASLVYSF
jgi:putative salt-induced outer membrane protein